MTIAKRNWVLAFFFATAVSACGGGGGGDDSTGGSGGDTGGGGGTGGTSDPPPASAIAFSQVAGTWFGTFDSAGGLTSLTITISEPSDAGATMAIDAVGANPSDLTGTVTRESDRIFRFDVSNGRPEGDPGLVRNRGALLIDPSATYLVFLSSNDFQFGVLEKGAAAPLQSDRAPADINGSWAGDTITTGEIGADGFAAFTSAESTAACTSATPDTPSDCNVTAGGASQTASSVTLADTRGRWRGDYPPQSGGSANRVIQAYASQDKQFVGAWACADGGYPQTCEFSAWRKGQ